jgi:predicted lysophospholipase L1 biosynthesis ABC-type transport system permease subunit
MARLKPGVSDAQFQAVVSVLFMREAEGIKIKEPKLWITAGHAGPADYSNTYEGSLHLLLCVVGVVLLVACANLAGLMVARGAARRHEFAVRAALGAGRSRLLWQSLTESLLVALLGGGLGLVIAIWGKTVVGRLLADSPEGLHYDTSLDLRVLSFTLAISLVTALLSGLLPALRAANVDASAGLKDRAALGALRLGVGRFLVTAQITLSLLLVCVGGLFVRTLVQRVIGLRITAALVEEARRIAPELDRLEQLAPVARMLR